MAKLIKQNPVQVESVPIGTVTQNTFIALPEGYVRPIGQTLVREYYPELNSIYAAEGYPFGAGDGSTTFTLPDYSEDDPFLMLKVRSTYRYTPSEVISVDDRLSTLEAVPENTTTRSASGTVTLTAGDAIGTRRRIISTSSALTLQVTGETIDGAASVVIPALGVLEIEKVSTAGWKRVLPFLAYGSGALNALPGPNVDAVTGGNAQWTRVGNIVTVSGRVLLNITAASTVAYFYISLPIQTVFTYNNQANGSAHTQISGGFYIYANTSGSANSVIVYGNSETFTGNVDVGYTYSYEIN